jgi:hypothetical protein
MVQFDKVQTALSAGQSVRLPHWESNTRMYIHNGVMVCQRGDANPYSYDLSWHEIAASNWQVIEVANAA